MNKKNFRSNVIVIIFIPMLMLLVVAIEESLSKNVDLLPLEVDGWKRSGDVLIYYPDNLYEYINGAADLYISYDFEELRVGEYINSKKSSIVVDIYRHRTPLYAFGIYSQEKPSQGNFIKIGAQGYQQELMLNFVKGAYYVKLSGSDISENSEQVLQEFARKIAHDLEGSSRLPQELSFFPEKNKIKNSEKFIAKNFLGYGFLHDVFSAEYHNKDNTFSIFILPRNSSEECRAILFAYIEKTKTEIKDLSEGTYTITDPYNGPVTLMWKSKFIAGILDLSNEALRQEYLQLLEKKIKIL